MQPWQEEQRKSLSQSDFGRKVRSWFEAWLNNYLGNRHVARAIIRYGCSSANVVTEILEAIKKEKEEQSKKRKRQDDAHGAEEPVWKLKWGARAARKAL